MQDGGVPAIEVRNLMRAYRGAEALRGVDLAVRAGEFFSVLGPSGGGKTTLLRVIGGFDPADGGEVLLDGVRVDGVPAERRDVNTVFQSYALFPHMNVRENVAFGLRRRGVGRDEIRRRVAEMLEIVELGELERRRPGELSGGQQQRVALARALVNRPRALLLDEPLAALDQRLRQTMQTELKRVQREVGATFLYVTHDQGEALALSDRIAVLNGGRIEQVGTPREVYERPATRFAAEFIGTSNLVVGTVVERVGDVAVLDVAGGARVRVPAAGDGLGDAIAVAVRPEKVAIGTRAPAPELCGVRGTVSDLGYLGTSTTYTVTTSVGEMVVFRQNGESGDTIAERGDAVWLSWEPRNSYALGADHGVVK